MLPVELQRLQFALKASLREGRYLEATKLALKAGGITAEDDRQRALIQAHTDLAARFIDPERIQELVSRQAFGSGWMGSHHAYEAALLSGCVMLVSDARSRLRMAYEWIDNWSRLTSEEHKNEKIDYADIAELTMAQLNIHGPGSAAESLTQWKPRDVSFRAGRIVAERLIDHGRIAVLHDLTLAAGDDVWLVIAIIVELGEIQQTPPAAVVERTFQCVSHWGGKSSLQAIGLAEVLALVEAALKLSLWSDTEAAAVLARHLPETLPRGLASRYSRSYSLLHAYCLQAALEGRTLHMNDLAHPELKTKLEKGSGHHLSQEAREFTEDVGGLLPWYKLWTDALLGKITKDTLSDRLWQARDATLAARTQYREEFHIENEIVLIWFAILNHLDASDEKSVDGLVSWIKGLRRPLYTPTLMALARQGAWNEETKPVALCFAAEAFALARDERTDAETKATSYIEIARSVLALSEREAKAYFDEAVAVSGRLGEENLWRWGAMLDLAERAGQRERPAPEAAYQFARSAELTWDYVVRDKHFDWHSTVAALSSLCPCSCFAIVSRWRDRGFGWTGRILPVAVHALVERGSIDPRDALALVGVKAEWDYLQLLGSVLEECTSRIEKEAAVSFLIRYLKEAVPDSTVWNDLKMVTARHGLSVPEIDDFVAFSARHDRTTQGGSAKHRNEWTAGKPSKRQWADIFSRNDLTTVDGISRSYEAFKSSPAPWGHDEFFAEAIRRIPAGGEAEFVSSVGSTTALDLYDLRALLKQIPDPWKGRPAVKRALSGTLKSYCRRYCMKIDRNRYYEVLPFALACRLTGLGEGDIVEVVLDAIGESPALADSQRLFSMVGLLKSRIDPDEALEALTFGLSFFDPVLEDKDGDGPWSEDLLPPASMAESIAGYLYAGLAAPTAAVRWQAAHAVLGVCALGRGEVLRCLMSIGEDDAAAPFADARLPFYRFHARQWLLIALARAAIEFPAALAPFGGRFVDIALDDQPHVMIRMFAARAALALIENGMLLPADLAERLSRVNITSLPAVKSKSYQRVKHQADGSAGEDDEDKFYFGLDIGPYWYKPLGRVFALSQSDVERKALPVIRGELNFPDKGAPQEDPRARRRIYDHPQTSASHGSYPNTDDLQYYLAYHAMMIVAGRLLATRPTHRDTEEGDQDEFAEWLSRHDVSKEGLLVAC